jgi:hypothetical protein
MLASHSHVGGSGDISDREESQAPAPWLAGHPRSPLPPATDIQRAVPDPLLPVLAKGNRVGDPRRPVFDLMHHQVPPHWAMSASMSQNLARPWTPLTRQAIHGPDALTHSSRTTMIARSPVGSGSACIKKSATSLSVAAARLTLLSVTLAGSCPIIRANRAAAASRASDPWRSS